jgi:hypothetical protein
VLAFAACAVVAAAGCGGGGGGSGAAVGDCIDAQDQVVDCGSSAVSAKLVTDLSKPGALACSQIGPKPQQEVDVGGGKFCAEETGAGQATLSKRAYAQKLRTIMLPLGSSLNRFSSQASSATSTQELIAALKAAGSAVRTASVGIGGLSPPTVAAGVNDALVTELNSYEGTIRDTEKTISSGSNREIQAQLQRFQTNSQAFGATLKNLKGQLQAAGIKVGG